MGKKEPDIEMRYQPRGDSAELDEIVSRVGTLHFEMLGDQSAMLRFGYDCMVIIFVDPKGNLRVTGLQDGFDEKVEFSIAGKGAVGKEPKPFFWEKGFNMDTWRAKRRGRTNA